MTSGHGWSNRFDSILRGSDARRYVSLSTSTSLVGTSWPNHIAGVQANTEGQSKLSAYDGDRISAEKAWIHYTRQLSLSSCGVVAVTIQECEAESLSTVREITVRCSLAHRGRGQGEGAEGASVISRMVLTVHRDGKPFPEHVSIDFTSRGAKIIDGIAKRLRNAAMRRDWQYQPGPDS